MRLDTYLTEKGYFGSRTKAKQAVERKEILVDGRVINKPAYEIEEGKPVNIEIRDKVRFVSLGGYKLQKALSDFHYDVRGLTVADLGASTGGFTDCLLKSGAEKVFAVDLNESLLHSSLLNDSRVVSVIKNARDLKTKDFSCPLDLITADLSFISVSYILPVISELLEDKKYAILLIKPQFETGIKMHFKHGIVKDKKIRIAACKKIFDCAVEHNLMPQNITATPFCENKNEEYLILLRKNGIKRLDLDEYFSR